MAEGKLTGDTGRLDSGLTKFLEAVAKYSGKDLVVKPKGGFRTASEEAEIVFKFWTSTLSRGNVFRKDSLSDENRKKLDDFYDDNDKQSFIALALKIPSYHKLGKAVDLTEPSSEQRKVLEKYMTRVPEKGCYHIQYKGSYPSEDVIKMELGVKE